MKKEVAQKIISTITNYLGVSVNQFSNTLGMKRSQWAYDAIDEKKTTAISRKMQDLIIEKYPEFNPEFIRTGRGNLLRETIAPINQPEVAWVPLVQQYAYAGYLSGHTDPEYVEQLPRIPFMPDRHMTGNWLAIEVHGDSMDDGTSEAYLQGDILICREVEPIYWRDSRLFINKRDFVVVTDEGIVLKRLVEHDVEHHTITLHSLNPRYHDAKIDLSDVRQIFSVVVVHRQAARR